MPKHKIYFTIGATLIMGLFIGFILSIKGFEPRVEFEIFTISDKAKMILGFTLLSGIIYLAGTEYNNL